MNRLLLPGKLLALALAAAFFQTAASASSAASPRETASFDRGWKFHLDDAPGAEQPAFDDAQWRPVDLPHDWMIEGLVSNRDAAGRMEGPFDPASPARSGGGFLDGGVGWYRKTFTTPASARGARVSILFDGAYMNSHVWINGFDLGIRPYGFTSFYYDLTAHLNPPGKPNVISVRLDVQQPCCRWYSGAGLYRHVWLITTQPAHIAQWGVYVTTPKVAADAAEVRIQTELGYDGEPSSVVSASRPRAMLTTILLDPDGKEAGRKDTMVSLVPGSSPAVTQTIPVAVPRLWSVEAPVLYRAVSEVRFGDDLVDSCSTPFGIRTIEFTKDNGFLLNGKRLQLKGVCDHHDLGCLGSAALRRGFERQWQILKAMGCNALRTSHNPPAPELLDLCDRIGIVVMDEAFDEWKHNKTKNGYGQFFDQWSQADLTAMLRRDRNHPSIILWSIGNEIPEAGGPDGVKLGQPLVDTCHKEDPTRPVTSACPNPNGSLQNGFDKILDVFGINYNRGLYGDPRVKGVEPLVGSETASQVDTRGEYGLKLDATGNVQIEAKPGYQVSSYDLFHPGWANSAEDSLLAVKNAPWLAGEFVWTGFDYLGEPTPHPWPARSSYFGFVDLAGFPKDRYYLYKSQWSSEPLVHILPSSWNWKGFEGKSIPVRVFTNGDAVELFLNGKSLGAKKFPADAELMNEYKGKPPAPVGKVPSLHLTWSVPYAPGVLKAVASRDGKTWAADEVHTAGDPAQVQLTPDRDHIDGDGQDLSFVKVAILDKDGNVCPDAADQVVFKLDGAEAEIAGLDNGDPTNHEAFKGVTHKAFHGLALAVLKSRHDADGTVTLTATVQGLPPVSTTVTVTHTRDLPQL